MLNIPLFGKKKLFLAFEYGLVLAQVAQIHKVELTPEIVMRAEKMIEGEFPNQSPTRLAAQMEMLILSVFELDASQDAS